MKIQIAFYKGDGNILNKIVRWWTNSVYSHAELVIPETSTWMGITPLLKSKINAIKKEECNMADWDFIDIEISQSQYNNIMEFYEDTHGHGYDWIGMLLSQFLPCKIKHKNRWYCSEWIAYALRISGIIDWRVIKIYDRKDLSPAVLYDLVTMMVEIKDEI